MISLRIKNFHPRTVQTSWDDEHWRMTQHWGENSGIKLWGSGEAQTLMIVNEDFSLSLSNGHLEELKTLLLQRA